MDAIEPHAARAWRAQKGLTQAAVARRLGVTRGHYALWEQQRRGLSQRTLRTLQQMVGRTTQPAPVRRRALDLTGTPQEHKAALTIVAALMNGGDLPPAAFLEQLDVVLRAVRKR